MCEQDMKSDFLAVVSTLANLTLENVKGLLHLIIAFSDVRKTEKFIE